MSPPPRIDFRSLCSDFFRDLTEIDRGLLGTVINLTRRPSRVIDTFLFVDRSRFVRPTRYVIFCFSLAAIQVFAIQAWYGQSVKELNAAVEATNEHHHPGPSVGEQIDRSVPATDQSSPPLSFDEFLTTIGDFLDEFQIFSFLLFLPFLSLTYFFLFPRNRYNLAETVVGATYLHAHATFLGALLTPLFFLGSSPPKYELWSSTVETITGIYLLIAVTAVFARRWWESLVALLWGMFSLVFLSLLSNPLIYVVGALARICLSPGDPATFGLSSRFFVNLFQSLVVLPLVIVLLFKLHPLRKRQKIDITVLQWLLLIGLFTFLVIVSVNFK